MTFKPTREQDFQNLTATVAGQAAVLARTYVKTLIQVDTVDASIRIAINGIVAVADMDGTKAIKVNYGTDLYIDNHYVESISFIRDTGEVSDVDFHIFGMSRKFN